MSEVEKAATSYCEDKNHVVYGGTHSAFLAGAAWQRERDAEICESLRAIATITSTRSIPWNFRNERDVRTAMYLTGTPSPKADGTEHHALEDAKRQARAIIEAMGKMGSCTTYTR